MWMTCYLQIIRAVDGRHEAAAIAAVLVATSLAVQPALAAEVGACMSVLSLLGLDILD